MWLGRRRAPGSDEDQYEQRSFHPGLSLSKSRRCREPAISLSVREIGSIHSGAHAACEELYWMVVSLRQT
ncbi:MAG: hypothetical protein ACLPKT_18355, partial [Methylocella sp.]